MRMPSPDELTAAIERRLPAGPALEQRLLNALAHHLAAQPDFNARSATAVQHLRLTVSKTFKYKGLKPLVAGRPDVFAILEDTYYLRSPTLRQGPPPSSMGAVPAVSIPPAVRPFFNAPPAAAPSVAVANDLLSSLPATVRPFFVAMAKALHASTAVLTSHTKKRLAAAVVAHWQNKPHGTDYTRAALALIGPKNQMPPLVLPSCELVFACGCAQLGVSLSSLALPYPLALPCPNSADNVSDAQLQIQLLARRRLDVWRRRRRGSPAGLRRAGGLPTGRPRLRRAQDRHIGQHPVLPVARLR
jgi:hypothetical protein